jgi:hypothetical protein
LHTSVEKEEEGAKLIEEGAKLLEKKPKESLKKQLWQLLFM